MAQRARAPGLSLRRADILVFAKVEPGFTAQNEATGINLQMGRDLSEMPCGSPGGTWRVGRVNVKELDCDKVSGQQTVVLSRPLITRLRRGLRGSADLPDVPSTRGEKWRSSGST